MNGYQVHWSDGQNWNPSQETERLANLQWNYEHQQSKHSGMNFAFQKRTASIDWRKIAGADVDVITRTMDFNALQDNIINVAFCDIERELLLQQVDPTYVKVFQLAQLTIEYLLHSQEFLLSQMQESQLILNQSNEELQKFKPEVDKLHEELNDVKKESHKRKKIIATQQMIMKIGKDSYNKCPFCEKAFMNQSFLTAHIRNRHSKDAEAITTVSASTMTKDPLGSSVEDKENVPRLANGKHLEKEMKALKEQLHQLERQLAEERQTKNVMTLAKSDRKIREEMDAWKESQRRDHEEELKRLKESFLREINELHEKRRSADEALNALQKRKGQGVSTESDRESVELRRQREEAAQLREELVIQKIDVVKLKEMLQAKLRASDEKPKSKRGQLDRKITDGDPVEKREIAQSLGHRPLSEQPQQSRPNDNNDSDDEDDDEMLLTEASNFEESLALSQRTFPTIESATQSLTEMGLNSYRQKLDKNSTLMKGFRKEAEQELEARMEKWGINPDASDQQFNSRSSYAIDEDGTHTEGKEQGHILHQLIPPTKPTYYSLCPRAHSCVIPPADSLMPKTSLVFRNFYDVRNQYMTTVDQVAKEYQAEHKRTSQQQQSLLRKRPPSARNQGPASSGAASGPVASTKSSASPAQGNMAATLSSTGQSFSEIGITYTSTGSSFTAGSLSVKDLESDEDDLLPVKNASAAVFRNKQPPTALDHAKQKQQATLQSAKRETVPAPKSGNAESRRNDDSDWDEISEIPVDVNQPNPGSSSSAVQAAGSSLQSSQTKPKPSPRARHVEMGSMSSLEEPTSPSNFATSQNLQRHTLPRSIMHSSLEPSFTGSLTKGKKLRNSVTFSDDLESTEEALSVRDL